MLESHSLTARLSPLKKSRLMIYPPNLPAVSDVLGTGWFAADAANVKPGSTVVVVGDGAVGLLGVLSTKHIRSHH
jgi:threonine dehydrogenase-like Zn-dependent dehydrogenase